MNGHATQQTTQTESAAGAGLMQSGTGTNYA